jgi:hypothetical protein
MITLIGNPALEYGLCSEGKTPGAAGPAKHRHEFLIPTHENASRKGFRPSASTQLSRCKTHLVNQIKNICCGSGKSVAKNMAKNCRLLSRTALHRIDDT